MIDVAPLVPEARPPALAAARAYLRRTRPWFVGLLVHGSALKGGFVPGCSDIDFQLFLSDGAFEPDGPLRLEIALAIQQDLAKIDPSPFQYIQGYAVPHRLMPGDAMGSVGPVPGTYHLLAGSLPVPEATAGQVRNQALARLAELHLRRFDVAPRLLDSGGGRLERTVRLLCTDVWPTLNRVLALRMDNPMAAWQLPKEKAVLLIPGSEPMGRDIRRFYTCVLEYYPAQESVELALKIVEQGVAFLHSAREWYDSMDG